MASHLAAETCEPPTKRLKVGSDTIQTDPVCSGSCLESPLDDSNAFGSLGGKFWTILSRKTFLGLALGLKNQDGGSFFVLSTQSGLRRRLRAARAASALLASSVQSNFLVTTSTNDNMPLGRILF